MNAKEIARRVVESRAGGRVERCHTISHLGSYSNASHSWGVAMLMHFLWPKDFPRLALMCLTHDVTERITGDIPSPMFYFIPGLRKEIGKAEDVLSESLGVPRESDLSAEDRLKLKACDHLELWIWCKEQVSLGNKFAEECSKSLEEMWASLPLPEEAQELRNAIEESGVIPERSISMLGRLM